MKDLTVSPSPHIRSNVTTSRIMLHVMIALLPALVMSAVLEIPNVKTLMTTQPHICGNVSFAVICC